MKPLPIPRRLAAALGFALLTWVLTPASLHADDLVRLSRNLPGESKPVQIDADEVFTWTEGDLRVLLLRGQVLVQHGVLRTRAREAVLVVDMKRYQATRVWDVDIYAEGDAVVQDGPEVRTGPAACVDVHTRGELKVQSHKNKVSQQRPPDTAVVQRALRVRAAQAPPGAASAPATANTVRPASFTAPPDLPATAIQPTQFTAPGTLPAPPVAPPGTAPAPAMAPVPAPPPGYIPPPAPPPGYAPPPPAPPAQPGSAALVPPTLGPPALSSGPPVAPPVAPPPGLPPGPPARAPGQPGSPLSGILAGPLGGTAAPGAPTPVRQYSILPRTPAGYQSQLQTLPNGEKVVFVTGGFVLNVKSVGPGGQAADMLDIEADRLVLWTQGGDAHQLFGTLRNSQGAQTNRDLEFYLAGNVEIRSKIGAAERTLRADEVYYDVSHNVAVAISADLEFRQPGIPDPVHFRASEIDQLSPTQFRATQGEFFSSRLPSDPGLKVVFSQATLEERRQPKRSIFGPALDERTGQPDTLPESFVRADNVFLRVEDTPVFYLPYIQGDARDPLGPVESINLGYSRIFGAQIGVGLDVYDLFGLDRIPNTRWRFDADYLSERGPALGTTFDFAGRSLFGLPSRYTGQVKLWGIYDTGTDVLGGGRGENDNHPDWRGRADARVNILELPEGFSAQAQIVGLSDKNFYEQYWKREFDSDPNKETFLYVRQQQDNWAWTFLVEPRLRDWVTETQWLPRADGYLIGQSFFDLLTYNAHAQAGWAMFRPTNVPPLPFSVTDQQAIDTGRFALQQELSLPLYLGPVKVVPYGVLDLAYYTEDLAGDSTGRLLGGGGLRGSLPLTRLYPDAHNQLLNLNGLNHKVVLSGNYLYRDASSPFDLYPQLDRLNDDATDQSQRDIRPNQATLLPNAANGLFLSRSPLFDPQVYALRRLVDTRLDTLDSIQVLQLDLRQRWQTKRGFPGNQHIIDWMTLDLSASYFPQANQAVTYPYPVQPPGDPGNPATFPDAQRQNFGSPWAFLEYDWVWNVGDRTALVSSGWYDPIDNGARVFTVGAYLNRPDRTNFYLGYREIQPIGSQAVSGAVTYIFSPKYAITAGSVYDFGTNLAVTNSLTFTRMGTDLQVSLGFTYNTMQNNFGFQFEILPNLVQPGRRVPGLGSALLR